MKFQRFVQTMSLSKIHYVKNLIKWIRDDVGWWLDERSFTLLPKQQQNEIETMLTRDGRSGIIATHCMNCVLANGPRILRLNTDILEIFENIDLRININEYMQPFRAVVVEFPDDYTEKKICKDPLFGVVNDNRHQERVKPLFVILVHEKELNAIFVSLVLSNTNAYNVVLDNTDRMMQEIIDYKITLGPTDKSLPITEEEVTTYRPLIISALNAALYVSDCGYIKLGPDNPKYHSRLQRYVDMAKKGQNKERIKKAEQELRSIPIVYTIKQNIKVKTEITDKEIINGTGTGIKISPHWRRGHMRNQRYGPGLSQVKRIRIWPVLINADYFVGGEKDTSSIYIVNGKTR